MVKLHHHHGHHGGLLLHGAAAFIGSVLLFYTYTKLELRLEECVNFAVVACPLYTLSSKVACSSKTRAQRWE